MEKNELYEAVFAAVEAETGVNPANQTLAKRGATKKAADAALETYAAEFEALRQKVTENALERLDERNMLG